jgi:hypothetical protein
MHAALEPFMAALLIASPWIFGFSDVSDAKTLVIAVGIIMLITGAMTRWRYAIARVIPLEMHFAADLALGALLILSPFIFGFSDAGAAARFTIIVGAGEILAALATRWDPAEDAAVDGRSASGTSRA